MAYTLLNAINATLKRVNIIGGDVNALTTLTDSARQNHIDVALQVWNAMVHELYRLTDRALPTEVGTVNLTLAAKREYTIGSGADLNITDFEQIRWPLIDETNGQWINQYPGGWDQMRRDQLQPSQWTGLPHAGVISPETGALRLDRTPESSDVGKIYVVKYDKRFNLSSASDTFPFSDTVVDALVDSAAEIWKLLKQNSISEAMRRTSFARAAHYLTQNQPRSKW